MYSEIAIYLIILQLLTYLYSIGMCWGNIGYVVATQYYPYNAWIVASAPGVPMYGRYDRSLSPI